MAESPTLNSMTETQLSVSIVQCQLPTHSFSKSSNSQGHLFWARRHPHSSPNSRLGFIMTMLIVISFAHERKPAPNDYALNHLTRIVQSPTKLNDKIQLTKKVPVERCPWCNGYRRRKWTRRHEFKSFTRLIAFHIALIPLVKV